MREGPGNMAAWAACHMFPGMDGKGVVRNGRGTAQTAQMKNLERSRQK